MHQDLTASLCVTVRSGCPLRFHLGRDGEAEFAFGGQRDGFELVFETKPLRELVKLGAEALCQMDALRAS